MKSLRLKEYLDFIICLNRKKSADRRPVIGGLRWVKPILTAVKRRVICLILLKAMPKKYIRDKRSPKPLSESTSKVMSANKAKNTKPEIALRKALWSEGYKGYRLNWKNVPGRPDIAYPGKKIAIFVNGCYWHRCPKCDLPWFRKT